MMILSLYFTNAIGRPAIASGVIQNHIRTKELSISNQCHFVPETLSNEDLSFYLFKTN